jgi:type II restriction enzyme
MNLEMGQYKPSRFKSNSQIARVVTEAWGEKNLYCAACKASRIIRLRHNTKAVDFRCDSCSAAYQLKSSRTWNERRIPDAGYNAMMEAIVQDRTPNLLILQYSPSWAVINLLLIPSFFFTMSTIEKRKPLSQNARRAGWIGCNILLSAISSHGKLRVIRDGVETSPDNVRKHYQQTRPLSSVNAKARGWTLDVLRAVQKLEHSTFSLQDIYAAEEELAIAHPNNRNVRAKIRQQLQVLRDLGFLTFRDRGIYELRE